MLKEIISEWNIANLGEYVYDKIGIEIYQVNERKGCISKRLGMGTV